MSYSLAITGAPAGQTFGVETLVLPDGGARDGEMVRAMQLGTPQLCRLRDGSLAWYVLDAERSTPTVPVLRAV